MPLIASFLEFSPTEKARLQAAQLALQPTAENFWGLLGRPAADTTALSASLSASDPHANVEVPLLTQPDPAAIAETDNGDVGKAIGDKAFGDRMERTKLTRMKKLLAAADAQLAQASRTIEARETEIWTLKLQLSQKAKAH